MEKSRIKEAGVTIRVSATLGALVTCVIVVCITVASISSGVQRVDAITACALAGQQWKQNTNGAWECVK